MRTLQLHRGILLFTNEAGIKTEFHVRSGRDSEKDYKRVNYGPIPPGDYILEPKDISGGVFLFFYWEYAKGIFNGMREGTSWGEDWGYYRVPVEPTEETNVYGRTGFSVHGGITPGSAGCIELENNEIVMLRNLIFAPYDYRTTSGWTSGLKQAYEPIHLTVLDPPI